MPQIDALGEAIEAFRLASCKHSFIAGMRAARGIAGAPDPEITDEQRAARSEAAAGISRAANALAASATSRVGAS